MHLCYVNTRANDRLLGEFALLRYFDIARSIRNVDRVLMFFYLRSAAIDKFDNSVTQSVSGAGADKAAECYGVVPLRPVISVHRIVGSNCCVSFFTSQLL